MDDGDGNGPTIIRPAWMYRIPIVGSVLALKDLVTMHTHAITVLSSRYDAVLTLLEDLRSTMAAAVREAEGPPVVGFPGHRSGSIDKPN